MEIHPDFDLPWCKALLHAPDTTITETPTHPAAATPARDGRVSNSMFVETLYTPTAIRAQLNFTRPAAEPDALPAHTESCYLLSVGAGLDGLTGRAHGGFSALVLDQITGTLASRVSASEAPATATMTVDYRAPVDTPGVLLCRAWAVERSGRKTWVRGRLQDGRGRVLAEARALFVSPRAGGRL